MAAYSGGPSSSPGAFSGNPTVESNATDFRNGTECTSNDCLLTDMLNCYNSAEMDDFVQMFTSQPLNSVSTANYGISYNQDITNSQSLINYNSDFVLQQSDIENLDSNLENLYMYISKLLDLCANSKSTVCWYRNVLCSRAKRINECPQGNLVNRKSTKCGTSAEKYAKDCFILYMFTR